MQDTKSNIKTKYWHKLDEKHIQCDLCPRYCRLADGQQGLCFIRANIGNEVVMTSYGRSSGFCVDPIEKKPLNHFYPGSAILSFGTAGCNLSCKFCQNWDISKSRSTDSIASYASPTALADAAFNAGCKSVAYTYNDPIIFHEYAIDVAIACKEKGIKSVAVSSGYINPEPCKEFYSHMDAVNIDLKSFNDNFYYKLTGGRLQPVLDTLIYLKHETNVWFEITTLIIPGQNDSVDEIEAMSKWVVAELGNDVPMHFSAFHPDYKMLTTEATPIQTLKRAQEIAQKNGVRYVYTGNVHDKKGQSTYCHNCGEVLIGRDWYQLSQWNLDKQGKCKKCGTECAGLFDATPGTWGAKRQRLIIKA